MRDRGLYSLEHLIEAIDAQIQDVEDELDNLDEVKDEAEFTYALRTLENLTKQRRELMVD